MKIKQTCAICKRPILPNDNYVRLTDYFEGQFLKENFYHTKCYNNQVSYNNPAQIKLKTQMQGMMKKALNDLDEIRGKEKEETYIVS